MMRSIRKHASSWFHSHHFGSNEHLHYDIQPAETPIAVRRSNTKTEFELTSVRTKQLLEKGKFQKVVEMLRELSRDYLLKCLESFPFKALNKSIPDSFPVWETLLMKLHNNEDGYIPQFPYAACDKLVLQIGRLLESIDESSRENADLVHACKRVLKKVYMQYNGVLEPLYKEHERTEHALYSLSLHLPLGTDLSAVPLHVAIKAEVEGCLTDYQDAIERLEELSQKESLSLSQVLYKQGGRENGMEVVEFHAPNPNQIQLQERLYFNQCIMRALQPKSRHDNLSQLLEVLSKRILGDKEVIALFGDIRMRNESVSNTEPVEPWLRKHQKAIECSIAVLKDIEKELEINIPRTVSPTETGCSELSSSLEDPEIVPIPVLSRKYLMTDEQVHAKPSAFRRGSAAPVLFNIGEREGEDDEIQKQERRYSGPPQHRSRSRSASPNKFLHTNGINGIRRNATENSSLKSLDSSRSSCRSLNGKRASSSIHDLNSTAERFPTLAFTRVQSLKASANHTIAPTGAQASRTLVAGRRKSEAHINTLSTSNGNVDKPSKLKRLFRSGSGGLVTRWDTQQRDEGASANLFWELEFKTKQLQKSQDLIHDLQRRERELTDRLSEQAQRQLLDSEKFEDILLGASRPTIVIQRYEELYSQARLEALDAIEGMQIKETRQEGTNGVTAVMDASDMFNVQLMLDVFKLAYEAAWNHLQQLHCSWKQLLGVQTDTEEEEEEEESSSQLAEKQLESAITVYFRRVCPFQDLSQVVKLLMSQLETKFSSQPLYTKIKSLAPYRSYIEECVRVAWGLCIQTPPMTVNCESTVYNPDLHKRFYNADKSSTDIIVYMWPALVQSSGPVLVRGVVLT